jgi:hypothetical protein
VLEITLHYFIQAVSLFNWDMISAQQCCAGRVTPHGSHVRSNPYLLSLT